MQIVKHVSIEDQEVRIDISAAEAVQAILEDVGPEDAQHWIMLAINNVGGFFRNIPDTTIAALNEKQRTCISDFFAKQAERFKPVAAPSAPQGGKE